MDTVTGTRSTEAGSGPAALRQRVDLALVAGGDRLYIAANWEKVLALRYAEIIELSEQGLSPEEISRTYEYRGKYSSRTIRSILAGRFELLRDYFPRRNKNG